MQPRKKFLEPSTLRFYKWTKLVETMNDRINPGEKFLEPSIRLLYKGIKLVETIDGRRMKITCPPFIKRV
jgi:hypothetical protein